MKPRDDPSWNRYAATILHFAPGPSIDLRCAVTAAQLVALHDAGMHNPFAVITAENPRGRDASEHENARRRARLLADLHTLHAAWIECTGASPDGRHREHGAAVELTVEHAFELAVRHEQSAFYWFDGSRFSIRGALVDVAPIALPQSSHT